jgi:hypothetical protein
MGKTNFLFRRWAVFAIAICSYGLALGQTHITDREGLENIKNDLSGSYVLDNNIDLSDGNWTPLGNFTGTLDGNQHVIFNLTIDNLDAAAFFSTISGNAHVKNLGFENASVTTVNPNHARTAVLTAFMEGNAVIESCYIANSTVKGRWCVGSFVGRARNIADNGNAAIRSCYSSAYLSIFGTGAQGTGMMGGIIGNIYDGNKIVVESCYFSGVIQREPNTHGNAAEGQVAGIVGWIGNDNNPQTLSGYTIQNNVSLAPYLLNNNGKHRISSTRSDATAVNDPTPGPNYSLSTTVVSVYGGWDSTSAVVAEGSAQYGSAKKDGANIPNGDANAKTQAFYAGIGWDFGDTWTIDEGNAYPVLQWADATRPSFVAANSNQISLTAGSTVDLSKYIFSGRGLTLTFTPASDKIAINDGVVSVAQPISAVETVTVSVQEGSLMPAYSLEIGLVPGIVSIATPQDLELVRSYPGAEYVLAADLDMSGIEFTPIPNFTGTLNGDGHAIFNLTPAYKQDGMALFERISGSAVIKNVGFENARVVGDSRVSVVAGYMEGSAVIENCYVANSTVEGRWCVGSFAGRATGAGAVIRSCYSSAYLYTPDKGNDGAGHTGGIVGNIFADGATVEGCYFSGIIQRILGNNAEGQVAGIVGWNGKGGPNQENVVSTIKNNVSLAPYLLSNYGKRRIAGAIQDQNGGDPTPGPNYSLSATVVSASGGWESTSDVITGESEQYGLDKKDGANIPGGDDKAKAKEFYEATLGWDFDDTWTIDEGNAYPVLQWADATRPSFVVVNPDLVSLTAAAPVDLSKLIFSGRGLGLTFSATSGKIKIEDGVVSFGQEAVTEADTVVVSVQEGSLTPLYSLQIALAPAYYSLAVGTFAGGSVTADKVSYVENEAVTLTIAPEAGYELAAISAHKTDDTEAPVTLTNEGSEWTFAMPAYDVTVSALFTTTAEYSVTVGAFAGGSVTADKASCKGNEAVTLTIAPAAGYELTAISAHKTGDEAASVALTGAGSERTFTMPAYDVTVTATFTKIVYSVTIGTLTGGSVTADKASCAENEAVTLTIAPNEGYELTAISAHKTGDEAASVALTGAGSERTFAMPAYGVTVTATFGVRQTAVRAENVSAVMVTGRNGEVQARFEGTATVKLYSLTGALLNEATASGGYTYSVRQKGIYVLSVAGKSYKVLVK